MTLFDNQPGFRDFWPNDSDWRTRTYSSPAIPGAQDAVDYAVNTGGADRVMLVDQGFKTHGYPDVAHSSVLFDCKSVAKALTGIAFACAWHRGDIGGPEDFVNTYLGDMPNNQYYSQLQLKHLGNHTSGLDGDYTTMKAQSSYETYLLGLTPYAAPGQSFLYRTNLTMLSAVLTAATGQSVESYLKTHVLDVIGVGTFTWDNDDNGINDGDGGAMFSVSDLIRICFLVQNYGVWDGTRLIHKDFTRELLPYPEPAALQTTDIYTATPQTLTANPLDYAWGFYRRRFTGVPNDFVFSFGGGGHFFGFSREKDLCFSMVGAGSVTEPDEGFIGTFMQEALGTT